MKNSSDSRLVLPRRSFLRGASAALAALPIARFAHAQGSGDLKLAMVGGGGRGSGAANQALHAYKGLKLVAIAELYKDRADIAIKNLDTQNPGQVDVPEERRFIGFEAYKQAIAACDVVVLATPCIFRPMMFEEAIRQGKHAFLEKPVAVDAPGARRVLAAALEAKKKGLKVGVGLQRRHKAGYIETIKRIQDGALGQQAYYRAYWNMGEARAMVPRKPGMTEMEFQLRNQFYFAWQCGDIIVDQGLHNLDVINWIKGAYPIAARGMGGAEVRKGRDAGSLYDHFNVEYEYADGTRCFQTNRQVPGCWAYVAESAHGSDGWAEMVDNRNTFVIRGKNEWRRPSEEKVKDPYQQEHDDMIAAIIGNQDYNEAERGALSTLSVIMGRSAAYSGKEVFWEDMMKTEKTLAPIIKSFDDEPPVKPDENGQYPLPVPGKYEAV
ncbi:MAG: Gfo/Idh/MocA family oxidoreductase [Chthoniobacteraceae bacterium]